MRIIIQTIECYLLLFKYIKGCGVPELVITIIIIIFFFFFLLFFFLIIIIINYYYSTLLLLLLRRILDKGIEQKNSTYV